MAVLKKLNYHRYCYNSLMSLNIPGSVSAYMAENGLPILSNTGWGHLDAIMFFRESEIQPFKFDCRFILIGELYEQHLICLNIIDKGIYVINNGASCESFNGIQYALINSSLPLFVDFIELYYKHIFENYDLLLTDRAIALSVSNTLEREFRKRDEPALEDESFWSIRLEELEYMI